MNELIGLAIVCGTFVLLGAFGLIFYLVRWLANTSQHQSTQNVEVMRHALAINSDCREFERIRFSRDTAPSTFKPPAPVDPFRSDPNGVQVDGAIPVGENGAMTGGYSRFERGE